MRSHDSRPADLLEFAGMLAAGVDPDDAYALIRNVAQTDTVQRMIDILRSTPGGVAALEHSERRWRDYGYPPPWETG